MSASIETQLAQLLEDPMSAAREAAQAGRRVVGYVGPDIPVEIILASGAVPVRLTGNADERTPHADRFVERAFAPEIRSIAEQWATGRLDFLDRLVLPRSDDSAQRLYYYLCELQRQERGNAPAPVIYDTSATERQSSVSHAIAGTLKLARELGAEESALPAAIEEVKQHTLALQEISRRQRSSQPLRGSVAVRLARALNFRWDAQFRQQLRDHASQLPAAPGAKRIVLAGNAAADDRLHWAIENGGGTVVGELTDANWFADRPTTEAPVTSLESLGRRAHARGSLAQRLARSDEILLYTARAVRADAVVVWLIEENSALGWVLPQQLAALTRAGVPSLVLTRQSWIAGAGTLDAIERFCAGLGELP